MFRDNDIADDAAMNAIAVVDAIDEVNVVADAGMDDNVDIGADNIAVVDVDDDVIHDG